MYVEVPGRVELRGAGVRNQDAISMYLNKWATVTVIDGVDGLVTKLPDMHLIGVHI